MPKFDLQKFSKNIDNDIENTDNISDKFFDKYLNDGIKRMVKSTVESEISKYVDISKMNDPVVRDEARDRLPYIRQNAV